MNTYTGTTTVSDGTLLVNGSIANSAVTVQSGATLGGTGTTGPLTINNGGTHSPGNSPGMTTVTGNYVENGLLIIEIGTPSGQRPGHGLRSDQSHRQRQRRDRRHGDAQRRRTWAPRARSTRASPRSTRSSTTTARPPGDTTGTFSGYPADGSGDHGRRQDA